MPSSPFRVAVDRSEDSMEAEREFDFLEGQWDAVCRVPSEKGWVEAPGTLTASRTLDGLVSLERFEGIYHGGALKGLGLRTDTLEPGHFHVWKGAFRDGKIGLFAQWS